MAGFKGPSERSGGLFASGGLVTDPDTTQGQSDESKKVEITEAELKALQEKASALETRLQAAEIERVRLEERAKAQEPKKPEGPVRLTHAQLQEAVDEGKITESDMQAELARQMREDLKTEIKADITAKLEAKEAARKIQDQFDGYLRLRPGVKTEGHEDRIAVQKEFQDLVALGYSPQEKRTEVLAMRNVFGPLDRIQETTRERTRRRAAVAVEEGERRARRRIGTRASRRTRFATSRPT